MGSQNTTKWRYEDVTNGTYTSYSSIHLVGNSTHLRNKNLSNGGKQTPLEPYQFTNEDHLPIGENHKASTHLKHPKALFRSLETMHILSAYVADKPWHILGCQILIEPIHHEIIHQFLVRLAQTPNGHWISFQSGKFFLIPKGKPELEKGSHTSEIWLSDIPWVHPKRFQPTPGWRPTS